ncbi:MAG: T9SS type A sorting domain-containing protein [Bacteroidetes bacterium]|nr:T9SS type A sorting domain-containing protein [Bacteroidota bacterium]MBL7104592.1 T9SS type A sorting domain-containing protein [Bacteroidales bacterium]
MKKKLIIVILTISFAISGHAQDLKGTVFFDDFESYNAGEQLVVQNPTDWTTWTNSPGSDEDPFIIDTLAYSGTQSVIIVDSNDLVKPIDNYTEGRFGISFKMYIPEGFLGYFNTLQLFDGINSLWGMQVFFEEDGNGRCVGQTTIYFNYSYNTWFNNDIIVDLDNDWAKYFFNNLLIHEWTWSQGGSFSGINQLGGSNFYSWDDNGTGIPKYFIDDYQIEELESPCFDPPQNISYSYISPNEILLEWDPPNCPNLLGYNIYIDGVLVAFITGTSYLIELGPGTYEICVTAVYETGESDCAYITIIITGIKENIINQIQIYPNPASDLININSDIKLKSIRLYNFTGQIIESKKKLNCKSYQLITLHFTRGVYLFRIETQEGIINKRIIIK